MFALFANPQNVSSGWRDSNPLLSTASGLPSIARGPDSRALRGVLASPARDGSRFAMRFACRNGNTPYKGMLPVEVTNLEASSENQRPVQ